MKTRTTGPAAAALQINAHWVRVGDGYSATYSIVGYPAEVGAAWLNPLLSYPGRVTVAVHTRPVSAQVAAPMLARQRARLESTRRIDAVRGRLTDPAVEAAATDVSGLAEQVARGASKLHEAGIYLTVHGRTLEELQQTAAGVRSAAASMLLDLQPATFRHHLGYTSTLPLGVDGLGMRRMFDTRSLAAAFPIGSGDLPAPPPGTVATADGVLYGVNTSTSGVVMWNRWEQDNHNEVVLARSGAGKSYLVKLEILRNLYQGVEVAVIDPEDEYAALAEHVGGAIIRLGAPGVRLNPFDLPAHRTATTLRDHQLAVHTVVQVMLGGLPAAERAALDRAIAGAYTGAGISHDPATWDRAAPLLKDLAAGLAQDRDPGAGQLEARLQPWVAGAYKDLFDGATSTAPTGHLVVWSLRHLPDELRTIATMLALHHVWGRIDQPATGHTRRLVVVDEAWLIMRDGVGARFLARMAKAARKRRAGLTVVTQDAADVLNSELGLAVVGNAATQVLMRQSTQAIDAVKDAFALTDGETRLLLSAQRGEGLLVAGRSRVPFRSLGSPAEHRLAVTGLGADQ
ncbi:VirB4 family type IV secretion system protein [Actinoplanes xinjiangensis]|uniref:VirB4 family type IV secretion system protein n=1 Tax=Actinoplanes xinjiangensis TaxID=512350 RepID=UPI00342276FB